MVQGSFKRQVEVGRVVLLGNGPHGNQLVNQLAVIVDIVDHSRAIVDAPLANFRGAVTFKNMILTGLVIEGLPRNAGAKFTKQAFEKAEIEAKWNKTAWAQKLKTRETRAQLTDFDRFKVRKLKAQRRFAVRSAVAQSKKAITA